MKLIIREYLSSLKERDELDAILPDLLSELGFVVYSRPQRGTTQYGVDIAAVGNDDDGEQKVFLLSVKQGDLTRQEWHKVPQGLRASLDDIRDTYIPTRVPAEYNGLKIVVCFCFGGDMQEQVRAAVTGYTTQNTTERISYREWNGDKIAEMLLRGVLREEMLPKQHRSAFQKAVAMVDEPDVAYRHFTELARQLGKGAETSQRARVTVARQLYVCLWILYVWARDVDNVEAPYLVSELVILRVWDLLRPFIGNENNDAEAISLVLDQVTKLHLNIASDFLERKIFPHVGRQDALSLAVMTRSAADVNLRLFDLLGRIAMTGLWIHWFLTRASDKASADMQQSLSIVTTKGFELIKNNSILFLPLRDDQAIEIVLFLMLAVATQASRSDAVAWLHEMVDRLDVTVRMRGRYPCIFTDYRDLVEHPRERSDEYFKDATSGSTIIPTLAAWACALNLKDAVEKLAELKKSKLEHCTLQLWLPDAATEESIYRGKEEHGVALCDLPISSSCEELLDTISEACKKEMGFRELSANQTAYWPIILLACRHHRYPVPPQFWMDLLRPQEDQNARSIT